MDNFNDIINRVMEYGFHVTRHLELTKSSINDAQVVIARDTPAMQEFQEELVSTFTVDQDYITLPADFTGIISFIHSSDLTQIRRLATKQLFDTRSRTEKGKPKFYRIREGKIELRPIPNTNSEYVLNYYREPAELVNNGDVPEIDKMYWHILVSYAVHKCYEKDHDIQMADYHRQAYERDLAKMRALAHAETDDTEPQQVEGSIAPYNEVPGQYFTS